MTRTNRFVIPEHGKVSLGPSGSLGPKTKLESVPASFLDKVPKVDAAARIGKSAAMPSLDHNTTAPPRQPLGAIGGSDAKAAPGSFLPTSAASKVEP